MDIIGLYGMRLDYCKFLFDLFSPEKSEENPIKKGKTGMLGLDRLKVRWDVALFFLHVIV